MKFTITTYNDIEIIVRNTDGYVNITKILIDNGKYYKNFKQNKSFQHKIDVISVMAGIPTIDILDENSTKTMSNTLRDTYAHPLLVNYVCMWRNDEYATKVDIIMNTINEELHLRNIDLQTKINEIKDEVDHVDEMKYNANDESISSK